jgi:LacI family transcriptional regulator
MRIAQKLGYKIPEDISFIGFTDGILSKFSNPTLTSVAQHGERMGEIAAEMLIEKVESESDVETYRTEIIEPTIIERESTVN